MPKQKFCLGRRSTQNILFALASAALGLFVALVLFPITIGNTRATGEQLNNSIDISVDAPIEINLTPLSNSMKIAKHTVTVNTGTASGYQLFIATDSAAHQVLYLDGDSSNVSNRIESTTGTYDAPATLALNTWGYAIAGLDNFDNTYSTTSPSTSSKFAGVPLIGDDQLIHEYDGSTVGDTTDVYFGVRSDSGLIAGDYETEVTYTALPAAVPRAAKAILGNNNTLTFVYDSNTYEVGDSYTNYKGTTTISTVWSVPTGNADGSRNDSSTLGWVSRGDIYYVDFDAAFVDFKPINVSNWFYYIGRLQEIVHIENFNTSEAISMERMFYAAGTDLANNSTMNLNLDNLQTGSVKNMADMFYQVGKKSTSSPKIQVNFGDLSGWDTSKVTKMSEMFYLAGTNSPVWDVGDIGKWDVGEVTAMGNMFQEAGRYSSLWRVGNLGEDSDDPVGHPGWKPAKVTNMTNMFKYSGANTSEWNVGRIGSWNTEKLTNMNSMFAYAGFNSNKFIIENLGDLNTSKVTNMETVFDRAGYSATEWDVGSLGYVDANHKGWDTSSVTKMYHMFYYAAHDAETFDIGNIGSWDVSKNKDARAMFDDTGYAAKTWNIGKLSYVDDNHKGWTINTLLTDMAYMFYRAGYSAEHVFDIGDLGEWNVGSVTDMSYMFYGAGYSADTTWNIGNLGYVDANRTGWNVAKAKNMSYMFYGAGYTAPSWDIGDIDRWSVGLVTNMSYMFQDAGHSAATWNIGDLSGWNTAKVTNMSYMFAGAGYSAATTWDIGDLDNWTVSLVSNMNYMFRNAGYSADTTWNIGDISGWVTKAGVTHTNFINTNLNNTNTITEPTWN